MLSSVNACREEQQVSILASTIESALLQTININVMLSRCILTNERKTLVFGSSQTSLHDRLHEMQGTAAYDRLCLFILDRCLGSGSDFVVDL